MAKLGSEIYRAVAVALLDWLLEAGPVLLVGVDEGALLHSFGPEPEHEETAAVSRAKVQEGGGGGRSYAGGGISGEPYVTRSARHPAAHSTINKPNLYSPKNQRSVPL